MKKRIFLNMCLISLVSIALASTFILTISYGSFNVTMKNQIKEQGDILAHSLRNVEDAEGFLSATKYHIDSNRITIVARDGRVVYDTHFSVGSMDNHLNRPEIKLAFESGSAQGTRFSSTLGEKTYYYALKLDESRVLRLSASTSTQFRLLLDKLPIIIAMFAFTFLLCIYISSKLTENITQRLNNINLDGDDQDIAQYDELSLFIRKINSQSSQIKSHVEEIEKRANTFAIITQNMKEGLITLDASSNILSVNKNAVEILSLGNKNYVGQNVILLSRNLDILEGVKLAQRGESTNKVIVINDRYYQALVSPIKEVDMVDGVILILYDVTDKEKADAKRREFSANVSHELKTPLTSISGYAELISAGIAKEGYIIKFASKISDEASRMILLVEDIIKISQLDERKELEQSALVNLYAVGKTVLERLDSHAQNHKIAVTLTGENTIIKGDAGMLEELIYNICDNAIKYNRENGSVVLEISRLGGKASITVSDTGIGIPRDHLDRIFERFYRVDKSRSKKTGGTGLGLAISKHIVEYHGGTIKAQSSLGQGTTIIITL